VPRLPLARVTRFRLALAAAAAALAFPLPAAASASASEATRILEACSNGTQPTGYSQQAYNQAIRQMPPELAEYTDCPDLIRKAQLAGAAAGSRGGAGGGPSAAAGAEAPPTPAEQHTLESVAHTGAQPVRVGGETIHPGVVHVNIASALSTLPTPLLAPLVLLLAGVLALLVRAIRGRAGRGRGRNHLTPGA
jgi:hypothetical protein